MMNMTKTEIKPFSLVTTFIYYDKLHLFNLWPFVFGGNFTVFYGDDP